MEVDMSSNLLSGLGKFGLGNLEEMKLFDEPEKKETKEKEAPKIPEEIEFLFDKSYVCAVCDGKFAERTIRANKARLIGVDRDLRPRHEHIDTGKYDVVSCPHCGFTALIRYFVAMTSTATKLIKDNITASFIKRTATPEVFTYDYAFERYQLCLANTIVKKAKDSEKAYVCLKAGWLLRGMAEELEQAEDADPEKIKEIRSQEQEFIKHAYDGFIAAQSHESFPMCGMDEMTVDYLLASLSITFKQYDMASRMISRILGNTQTPARIKEKARDLKDILLKEKKG
jgi:uncharacterized protein (DUF2225 family)